MFSTLSLSSLLARIFSPPPPRFRALPRPRHQLNLAAPVRSANDHPYLSLHSRPRSSWSNLINFVSAPKEDRVRISKEALESLKKYDAAASASKLDTAATNVIVGPNNPANTFAKRARIRTERRASRGQNTLPRGEDGRLNLRVTAPKYTIISSTASHQTLNDARSGGKSVRDQIPPNVFNQPSRATNKTSYPAENSARKSEAAVGLTQSAPPALGSTPELNVEGRSSSQASTSKRVVLEESPSYRGESVELEPLPISDQRTAPTTTILGPRRSTTRVESASVRNGPNVGSERIEQRVDPARAPVQTKETTISPSESVKTESVPLETSHDLRVEDQIAHYAFLEALYSRRPQIHWMVNPSFGITSHFLPPHSQITRRATLHSSHLRDVDQIAWYRARQDALRPPSQSILDARKSADAKLDRAHKLDLRRLEGKESIIEEQTVNLRIEQLDGFVRSLRTVRDEASVFHMSTVRPVEEETRLASELDRLVAAFTHVRDQPPTFPISGTPPSSVTIGAKEPVKALLFADADCTKPYYVPFSKLCQARPAGPSKRDLDEKRRVASRKEKEILLSLAQIAGQGWRRPQV